MAALTLDTRAATRPSTLLTAIPRVLSALVVVQTPHVEVLLRLAAATMAITQLRA